MSDNSTKKAGFLSITGGLLLFVWICGAVPAGICHEFQRKRQCIQTEGWLKGWLWCSTETRNSFPNSMLRGLLWPIDAIRWLATDAQAAGPAQPQPPSPRSLRSDDDKVSYSIEVAYSSLVGLQCGEGIDNGQGTDKRRTEMHCRSTRRKHSGHYSRAGRAIEA